MSRATGTTQREILEAYERELLDAASLIRAELEALRDPVTREIGDGHWVPAATMEEVREDMLVALANFAPRDMRDVIGEATTDYLTLEELVCNCYWEED